MRSVIKKSFLFLAISGVIISPVSNATNGYFSHSHSTKEKALAGAGTAYSQDAMAAATNPAGMAFVGERIDLGAAVFSPSARGYTVTGAPPIPQSAEFDVLDESGVCQTPHPNQAACAPPMSVNLGSVYSENDVFLIPHIGWNIPIGADYALGFSAYGIGMNTNYTTGSATLPDGTDPALTIIEQPGTFGAGDAGVKLDQFFLNVSLAKKINDKSAVGVSMIAAAQRFAAKGLNNFAGFSLDPNNLSSNKHSYAHGYGFKVGYQGEIEKGLRVGVSYQSKIDMDEFKNYSGLFAEGGEMDVPATYNVGMAFDVGSGKLIVDYQRILYSEVVSMNNPLSNLTDGSCLDALNATLINQTPTPASGPGCLGGSNGAGFGWEDAEIIKLGYQWGSESQETTYRIGYSHMRQNVIPESEVMFNILAPATIKHHFTAGLTARIGKDQEFNLATMYAPKNSIKGANPLDGGATQVEIEMAQWEIEAGWSWKY